MNIQAIMNQNSSMNMGGMHGTSQVSPIKIGRGVMHSNH